MTPTFSSLRGYANQSVLLDQVICRWEQTFGKPTTFLISMLPYMRSHGVSVERMITMAGVAASLGSKTDRMPMRLKHEVIFVSLCLDFPRAVPVDC